MGCCTCPELLHAEKERVLEKYTNYYSSAENSNHAWKCAKVKQPKIHRYRNVHGIISIFQTIPSEGSACMTVCNKTATYFTYMLDDFAMSYSLCSLFLKFPVWDRTCLWVFTLLLWKEPCKSTYPDDESTCGSAVIPIDVKSGESCNKKQQ